MPKVTEIIVTAGRTFSHPYESYSNLRPMLSMKATLVDGEDPAVVAKNLQAQTEQIIEEHKTHMLDSLQQLHFMNEQQREIVRLEDVIKRSQSRLEEIRKNPNLLIAGHVESDDDDFDRDDRRERL